MGMLDESWEDYRERIVPKDAPPGALKHLEYAFYAGAVSALSVATSAGLDGLRAELKRRQDELATPAH